MSKKVCFPICYGRGRCRVTIYNRTTALPYYRISYQLGTIRHQRTFKTLKDAKAYAKEVSAKLRSKDISLAQITKSELTQLRTAQEMLKPINCRVDEAVNQYAKAVTLLDDIPLENAVRFYMAHNKSPRGNASLNQLVCEFLEAKRQDGGSIRVGCG